MTRLLMVFLGGGIGSVLRYGVGAMAARWVPPAAFPLGTLLVNVAGCFLIGLAGGWADHRGLLSGEARLLLVVGFLGGFTTFSSFGYDTLNLLRGPGLAWAALNVVAQVLLGLAGVWAGFWLTSR